MATIDVFADGGEMGELMRSVRWPTRRSFPSSAQLLRWYRLSYLSNETTVRAWARGGSHRSKSDGADYSLGRFGPLIRWGWVLLRASIPLLRWWPRFGPADRRFGPFVQGASLIPRNLSVGATFPSLSSTSFKPTARPIVSPWCSFWALGNSLLAATSGKATGGT